MVIVYQCLLLVCAYTHTYEHTPSLASASAKYTITYTHLHACAHTRAHTHTHTHTHTHRVFNFSKWRNIKGPVNCLLFDICIFMLRSKRPFITPVFHRINASASLGHSRLAFRLILLFRLVSPSLWEISQFGMNYIVQQNQWSLIFHYYHLIFRG